MNCSNQNSTLFMNCIEKKLDIAIQQMNRNFATNVNLEAVTACATIGLLLSVYYFIGQLSDAFDDYHIHKKIDRFALHSIFIMCSTYWLMGSLCYIFPIS